MATLSLVASTAGVVEMTGLSRATLYRLLRDDPSFPKSFKIGLRKNAWLRTDVEAWIMARAAGVAA